MQKGNTMEQFTDFTYMKSMDLGSKANMSYRLRSLLNEEINLSRYGGDVQSVLISPLIGSILTPESKYVPNKKRLNVEFKIDSKKAMELNEAGYFKLMLASFINAMEEMELPKGFNFEQFKKDVLSLRFEQLPVAA